MHPTSAKFHRGTTAWFEWLAETGEWWANEYWRTKSYCENSPWTEAELAAGFEAARSIFDASTTRRLARSGSPLVANLLRDIGTAPFSGLLHLGLTARTAELQKYPELTKRLRQAEEHDGARFELSMIAALNHARVEFEFEPFKERPNGPNPDFRLRVGSETLIADAKAARTSRLAGENQKWLEIIQSGLQEGRRPGSYEIEYLPDFADAMSTERGRSWVRQHIEEISVATGAALRQVGLMLSFPASLDVVVDGRTVVRVVAHAPAGSTSTSGALVGAPIDVATEAKRVTRSLLQGGASQIPAGTKGMVILQAGYGTTSEALADEVKSWMHGEGIAYPDLVGALLICGDVVREWPWQRVSPVWRDARPALAESTWEALEAGLNYTSLRMMEWRQRLEAKSIQAIV